MHIDAHLGVDLVAVETADEVDLLLELRAPALEGTGRPAHTLVVVLDRSGSMAGEPLAACRDALVALVDRLDPADSFGLVVFDDEADLVVPAAELGRLGKAKVKSSIAAVRAGGSTDLSAGYLLGLREARRVAGETGATVLVISDGHANAGETSPDVLGGLARGRGAHRITTSTVGYGLGYDEVLLAAMARGGSGDHVMVEDADQAGAAVSDQVSGLLSKSVVAAALVVRPHADAVDQVGVYHDLPWARLGNEVLVEIGDLYAGEDRKILLKLGVPSAAALGLFTVAELELRYTSLPDLVEHVVTLPVSVNVVPADVAAGRVPRPVVLAERLIQDVQVAKKQATEALRSGDTATAMSQLRAARSRLEDTLPLLSPDVAGGVASEAEELGRLADLAEYEPMERSVKTAYESMTRVNRSKSRRPRTEQT